MNRESVQIDTGFIGRLGDNDIAAAVKAGMQCGTARAQEIEGIPHMLVPDGMQLISYEKKMATPRRIEALCELEEPDSFCAYVDTFRTEQTRLYGIPDAFEILSIFDDHLPGKPAWEKHRARLTLKLSPEWQEWKEATRRQLTQQDLADFLDEHLEQIAEPDAGDLLSDIRSISISSHTRCDSVQREGGDIAFSFTTEVSGTTKTERGKIPSRLTLVIAPFRSWEPVQVTVTLTYRLSKEKGLLFSIRMHQADAIVNKSYNAIRKHVEDTLNLPVLT